MKIGKKNTNFAYYFMDIRCRFFYLFLSFFLTFLTSYYCSMELIFLYVKPFLKYQRPFIFTELTEGLYITLNICTITSFFLSLPIICYTIWCFFIPSWFSYERRRYTLFFLLWIIFFFLSIVTIYYYILPHLYDFLLHYEIQKNIFTIQLEARINSYISWSLKALFLLSIFAQLPILCYLLYLLDILCPSFLSENRKYFFCFFLLTTAFLSPPEFLTQFFITCSIALIYEIIVWLGFFHASCANLNREKLPN